MKLSIIASVVLAATSPAFGALAESWSSISSSARVVYLADLSSIATVGDDTTIMVARIPLPVSSGDYSHKINEYAIRCATSQARIVMEIEYGANGAEEARYPDPEAEWDRPSAASLGAYIKSIACDNQHAGDTASPSIKAFIDGQHGG
ncbi:surface-adhesin E family protein [Brevundimonas pondensis]|jgi:hypothetical protein|uniref:Surface-adhesin protein E-like domain-containing protein n=1 Tax=Brevundimonas pondensis TaxID=2774189 RepID=A0ABX7SJH3_9CAUL|nr:surface-adhesin E family protein [Brevundimonas pondensis]QTC87847.1 hypothetical protein IFE19_00040 [Brevundimonas pondensis]